MIEDKKLFNTTQAASYLGLKTQTLHNWRHHCKGPSYIKMGRLCFYELQELDRFINANKIIITAQ